MNRDRLLADAKAKVLELAKDYVPPDEPLFSLAGKTGYLALYMAVEVMRLAGKVTPHDVVVAKALARVLSGGDTDMTGILRESELLDLERAGFMKLVREKATLARLEHMLETGRPLRN
jgi:3-hydroxyacyl-CoA dehydrogenase